MELSEIGKIVETQWLKTFDMRPDMNLLMADYVVMPNHFHAIIIIGNNAYNLVNGNDDDHDDGCGGDGGGRDAMNCVSTIDISGKLQPFNKFGPQSKNLASIIRGFKSAVTMNGRKIDEQFAWQPRYYEHIIRNRTSFNNISTYIQNNPKNWVDDRLHGY